MPARPNKDTGAARISPKAVVAIPTPRGAVHLHSPSDDPDFLQRLSKAIHQAAQQSQTGPEPSKVISRLISGGARLSDDAERVMDSMPVESRPAFREAVRDAIKEKAAGDPNKARKIFYSMSNSARNIFGDTYDQVRKDFDKAAKPTSIIRLPYKGHT